MVDKARRGKAEMEKLDESKPALSSWSRTHQFYGGASVITEFYNWSSAPRSAYANIPGFECAYELTVTFVERHTGVIEDTHYHFIASGTTIEKIKGDFRNLIFPLWKTARQLVPGFPAYTLTNLENILDPATDNQPRYFNFFPGYIELKSPTLKGSYLTASFSTITQKGSAQYTTDIQYGSTGEINAVDCLIRRRNEYYKLRIRNSARGLFPRSIDYFKSGAENKLRQFEATSYSNYIQTATKRGIVASVPKDSSSPRNANISGKQAHSKWLSPDQTRKLHTKWEKGKLSCHLTSRQIELLCLLCEGTERSTIATSLEITRETMKSYIKQLYKLLAIHDVDSLVAWARGQL